MKNLSHRRMMRGQSLAEMAVVIPVLVFLLMGGFDASVMISDKITAGYAVRQGARLAAEIGGSQTTPLTTAVVDQQIIRNVLAVARGLTSATPTEIDIYAPSRADGSYQAGDPLDQYMISSGGGVSAGTQTFPVQNRQQTPPNETSIGVRILWTYSAPAGIFPSNMRIADYAVMKAAPLLI
ncbi:MAG TPA: TadE/TadG family type IV pilus assembly protein [Candidatus Dormibacteraeota bacterium]|nr:TadE/TadG family type IV pilus assembly protein [Candidatus Dormibacteraeota bacterium]